jgi:hypothetical protein
MVLDQPPAGGVGIVKDPDNMQMIQQQSPAIDAKREHFSLKGNGLAQG